MRGCGGLRVETTGRESGTKDRMRDTRGRQSGTKDCVRVARDRRRGSPPQLRRGGCANQEKLRSIRIRADGVVLVKQFLSNWINTTPSAPSEVASRFLLDVAATPPQLRRGTRHLGMTKLRVSKNFAFAIWAAVQLRRGGAPSRLMPGYFFAGGGGGAAVLPMSSITFQPSAPRCITTR